MRNIFFLLLITLVFVGSCKDDDESNSSALELNFRLTFDGAVTPILDNGIFELPDTAMNYFINQVSFFVSELQLEETSIGQTEYVIFDAKYGDATLAEQGFTLRYNDLSAGQYQGLSFGLGVPSSENSMRPEYFPSSNPLSDNGEYWESWGSYIFTKIQGAIDVAEDDSYSMSMLLHSGGDLAFQSFSDEALSIELVNGKTTIVNIDFDINRFFTGNNDPYNVLDPNYNNTHNIEKIQYIIEQIQHFVGAMSVSNVSVQ